MAQGSPVTSTQFPLLRCPLVPTRPVMVGTIPSNLVLATHQLCLRLGFLGSSQSDWRGGRASPWVQLSPPALWRWRPVPRDLRREGDVGWEEGVGTESGERQKGQGGEEAS